MAYKLFSTGEVLTAANVNSYLMNQTVMVFASAAARTTALSGVLAEGMISYRTDSHILEYYDGTSWSSVSTSIPTSYGFSAGKNKIINGDFGVWQRGTSFTQTSNVTIYTSDRWNASCVFSAGTATITQQTFTPGTAPIAGYEGTYYLRQTLPTTLTEWNVAQRIEDVRQFAGQTATFSFWAKSSSVQGIRLYVTQNFGTSGSAQVVSDNAIGNLTTSWARYSITIAIPSVSGKTIGAGSYLQMDIWNGTSPVASSTIDIWGVQLEAGSTATAFQTATGTVQGELAACQRYYYRATNVATAGANYFIMGTSTTTSIMDFAFQLPVTLRVKAASIDYANLAVYGNRTATSYSSGTWTLQNPDTAEVAVARYTHGTAIFNAGADSGWLTSNTAATNYIGFSAEL